MAMSIKPQQNYFIIVNGAKIMLNYEIGLALEEKGYWNNMDSHLRHVTELLRLPLQPQTIVSETIKFLLSDFTPDWLRMDSNLVAIIGLNTPFKYDPWKVCEYHIIDNNDGEEISFFFEVQFSSDLIKRSLWDEFIQNFDEGLRAAKIEYYADFSSIPISVDAILLAALDKITKKIELPKEIETETPCAFDNIIYCNIYETV